MVAMAIGLVGAFIGLLIGVNQLYGIYQKVSSSKINTMPAAYAAPFDSNKTIQVDSTHIKAGN